MFLIFVGSYSIIINSSKRLFFFIEKLCFRIFRVENISISCEFIFFSCFKFVQLFIKITSSILKAYSVEQEFWKTLILQSFSYFKLIKVFKSGLNRSPIAISIVGPISCFTCILDVNLSYVLCGG